MAALAPSGTAEQRHFSRQHGGPFASCRRCSRDRLVCARKRRWDDWETASLDAAQQNVETHGNRAVVPYRCVWCSGWHVTTARTKLQRGRAEKARRKHLLRKDAF